MDKGPIKLWHQDEKKYYLVTIQAEKQIITIVTWIELNVKILHALNLPSLLML